VRLLQVIIVGGGLAGLSAAHTIVERGGRAMVIDKKGFLGGNSVKATSGINGTPTSTQAQKKIPDNAHIFYEDTALSAAGQHRKHAQHCRSSACIVAPRRSSLSAFPVSVYCRRQEGSG